MVLDIRTRFVFPFGKTIKFLISKRCEENLIFSSFVEEILQHHIDLGYFAYVEESFYIQFKQGKYIDSVKCRIFPLKNNNMILGKQWIEEKNATFDEETHI